MNVQWLVAGAGLAYAIQSGMVSIKHICGLVGVLGCGALFMLYKFQENLLYQPRIFPQFATPKDNPAGMRHPGEHGIPYEDVRITTPDGLSLHAWMLRPERLSDRWARPTLLFFHENAGNMGMRMDNLRMMFNALEANVMILSYRGYGESQGVPSEHGLYVDAEAALQWLLARTDIDRTRIVLFGRSLGGGVAIDLASKHEESGRPGRVAAVIIENSFASISAMVDIVFPWIAFAKPWILRMKWESVLKVPAITKPMLFISGTRDEIVPAAQM